MLKSSFIICLFFPSVRYKNYYIILILTLQMDSWGVAHIFIGKLRAAVV